jgi:ribosomal protein S19
MMSLKGAHNRSKPQKSFKQLTRKTRYGFLKRQIKLKYRSRDNLERRDKKRRQRVNMLRLLKEEADRVKKKKKEIVFTFRKANYPNRASFEPISKPIYNRSKIITEEYRDKVVSVYNGVMFFNYKIPSEAVGSKFGEISPTKQWKVGTTHVKRKKSKKPQKGSKGDVKKSAPVKKDIKKTKK